MKDKIIASFSNCLENSCIETAHSKNFKVFDRDNDCCFICIDNEPNSLCYFTVINPMSKPIHFLAIDRCLLVSNEDKKCDCAVFDEKSFHFIEIKTVKLGQRSSKRTEAFEQLKRTIGLFKEKLDFGDYEISACICFGSHKSFPRVSSRSMGKAKELFDLYKASFYEGNEIDFS